MVSGRWCNTRPDVQCQEGRIPWHSVKSLYRLTGAFNSVRAAPVDNGRGGRSRRYPQQLDLRAVRSPRTRDNPSDCRLCVVALPVAAAILGWNRHIKLTTGVCVVLTVWSAVNAYSAKQGGAILAAQSYQQSYEAALTDQKAARDTLARITETGEVEELCKLEASIETTKAVACRRSRSELAKVRKRMTRRSRSSLRSKSSRQGEATLATAKLEANGPARLRHRWSQP